MNSNNWDKFVLLMWKNFRLQCNHKIQVIFELFLPALVSSLLLLIKFNLNSTYSYPNITYFDEIPINLDLLRNDNLNFTPVELKLIYSPENEYLQEIVESANNRLEINYPTLALENSIALEDFMKQSNQSFLAAIQFDDNLQKLSSFPKNLSYALRFPNTYWITNELYPTRYLGRPRNPNEDDGGSPDYIKRGFIAIQNAVSLAFIEKLTKIYSIGFDNIPEIVMQRFPYPEYNVDYLLDGLESIIALIFVLTFMSPIKLTIRYIMAEKENQLKEIMKIMGLSNWLNWLAWFVKTFFLMGLSMLITVIVLTIEVSGVTVLPNCSWSALLVFLLIYCLGAITFGFLLSSIFSKSSTAVGVFGFIWIISYIPYTIVTSYEAVSLNVKLLCCLLPNSALSFGLGVFMQYESSGTGFYWRNLFQAINHGDLSLGLVIISILISSIIHMILTIYIEKINPGNFGIPEKWNFPFTKSFWCPVVQNKCNFNEELGNDINERNDAFEENSHKNISVSIRKLCKQFGSNEAVKNVSFNLYEDEITALLGHNGAGKTTIISMIAGLIPSTSGAVLINSNKTGKNSKEPRPSLGICPQYNILFDELTVKEHLIFFSQLKGVHKNNLESEIQKFIRILGLQLKTNTQSQHLSGGMKRKLSIGIALCGGSKVVILDEPTSGMDPEARRLLWDLLQKEKQGRTILLSTHFMDEADVLGDRIAIMSSGEIKCYGSPFFLKKKYGIGYHLICIKKDDCNPDKVTNLLKKYIVGIEIESNIGFELSYQLSDKNYEIFENLLEDLENNLENLKLAGYGVNLTNLEEVFMEVGSDKNKSAICTLDDQQLTNYELFAETNMSLRENFDLYLGQWKAMLLKKILHCIRNYPIFFWHMFLPILFILMTILMFQISYQSETEHQLKITLDDYESSVTVIEVKEPITIFERNLSIHYLNYINTFGMNHHVKIINTDFSEFLIKENIIKVNTEYLTGVTISKSKIIAWFNNQLIHTPPLSLNIIHNSIIRTLFPTDLSHHIEVINFPFETAENYTPSLSSSRAIGYEMAIKICLSMSFVTALYIKFVVTERETRAKLLQFVSGVRVWVFWFSHLIFDQIIFWITCSCIVIILVIFQVDGFSTIPQLGRLFLVLMFFGFSAIPFTYLFSFIFNKPTTAYSVISFFNLFTGIGCLIANTIMTKLIRNKIYTDILNYIFLFFPHYSLNQAIYGISMNYEKESICFRQNCENRTNTECNLLDLCNINKRCCVLYFGWESPGISSNLVFMLISAILYQIILFIKEYQVLNTFISDNYEPSHMNRNIDDDVKEENIRTENLTPNQILSTNLVLRKLTKSYKNFLAVNQISVEVKGSECFGLLGVNGAGKTSCFKMLTGDDNISFGDAFIRGISVRDKINDAYGQIGYCPQFDALFEDLTGRENLKIFCLLRGIPENKILKISEEMTQILGLEIHMDKPISCFSGGNKRKLSTMIAMLGNSSVIYLDEPTTGIDPTARRQLWNVICKVRDSGKSIVLTSHSMEECEALCTRLAIMVNGEFKCIGSTQHLKNKFSKGIVLKIKLKKDENANNLHQNERPNAVTVEIVQNNNKRSLNIIRENSSLHEINADVQTIEDKYEFLKEFVKNEFPGAVVQEEYQGLITFHVPMESIKWSKIFGTVERNKTLLGIEDYSISQTTLEQIFIFFAKQQWNDHRKNQ